MIALKRILVPYDFSEASTAAVKYGSALAHRFEAQLILLHVGDQTLSNLEAEFQLRLENVVEDAVRERLLAILTPDEQTALKPELAVRSGAPAAEIIQFAKERNIDLIVMGTHGRGFVGHVVMGSVAEKVVRLAPCPVLTVRNPQHEFVVPDVAVAAGRAQA